MEIRTVTDYVGIIGILILAGGLAAVLSGWHRANIYVRAGFVVAGGAAFAVVLYLSRREPYILSYLYIVTMGMLLFLHVAILVWVLMNAFFDEGAAVKVKAEHPLLRKARRAARSLDFAGAVRAYDEYLEKYEDPAARAQLAEVLIKAGNSRRALSVLTLAFTEAEQPRQKITLGVRLAELILVTRRDPTAARAQLEQVRELFKGTEEEDFAEDLAGRMIKRVAEGRYLKGRPDRPRYDT